MEARSLEKYLMHRDYHNAGTSRMTSAQARCGVWLWLREWEASRSPRGAAAAASGSSGS